MLTDLRAILLCLKDHPSDPASEAALSDVLQDLGRCHLLEMLDLHVEGLLPVNRLKDYLRRVANPKSMESWVASSLRRPWMDPVQWGSDMARGTDYPGYWEKRKIHAQAMKVALAGKKFDDRIPTEVANSAMAALRKTREETVKQVKIAFALPIS